ASADSTSALNATQEKLGTIMSNGEVHGNISEDGTPIASAEELRNFLKSGNGKGYLTRNIDNFYWDDGRLTSTLSSVNMTELNGNGHTITLKATNVASSPSVRIDNGDANNPGLTKDDKGNIDWTMFMSTYFAGQDTYYTSRIDLHGGLIGFLRNYQTIKNCKFVYSGNIDTSYKTDCSGAMGLIVALSLGTIDNCSLEVNGKITYYSDTTLTGNTGGDKGRESRTQHSFALGGFAGAMTSSNARVSNSKITLNKNLELSINSRNGDGGTFSAYHDPYSRCWTGGVVGWIANSAQVYNIVTAGSGDLDARGVNDQVGRSRASSGIVAGIAAGDGVGGQTSLAGLIDSCGTINGVINNWTGHAKFLTYDTAYSPLGNDTENSLQYLVVGVAGMSGETTSNVDKIYMNKDVYSGDTFSIGYDYTVTKGTNGVSRGRYSSINILMQTQYDNSNSYVPSSEEHAYLTFAGTAVTSNVWAVYDVSGESVILWSKTVNGSQNPEIYYDKAVSIEDAKKFDVTHTEIQRSESQNYVIQYSHGRAVYFKKSYDNVLNDKDPNRVVLNPINYGAQLSVPMLDVYSDGVNIKTIKSADYWESRGTKNNKRVRMSDLTAYPDTYESYLFIESSNGLNYNYIQMVDLTHRYVSYIYDDPVFLEYKKTHPDYEPVVDGVKQTDWQQRVAQTVNPKTASVVWNYSDDITKESDIETDSTGNIISYGKYTTPYDGDPVVFDISLPNGLLINNDACTIEYEYRVLDTYTNQYTKIDSCVNAGTYKVVVTGLSNSNYALAGAGKVEYCIDFDIETRKIGFTDNLGAELKSDDKGNYYHIKVEYSAEENTLAKDVKFFATKEEAEDAKDAKIALYNILGKDKSIIKFGYLAYGDGELDMLNVGKFEMILSLVNGNNSVNYELPDETRFVIEIVPADVELSEQRQFEYPYGYTINQKVAPFVKVEGKDDIPLTFNKETYYQKINGVFEIIENQPVNAGEYQILYEFENAVHSNYNDASILIDVTINPRKVGLTYTVNNENRLMTIAYGTPIEKTDFGVIFNKEGDNGIDMYQYSSAVPVFKYV
ncbi:MAG: hypothetical protein K2L61_03860, partial [Clostridia bacterium]|nr:hypothetical protein [Clostridia bacterium]